MAEQTRAPTSDEAVAGTWSGSVGSRWTLCDDYPDTAPTDSLRHGTTAGNITFGFSAFSVPTGATAISVFVDYYEDDVSNGSNNVSARLKVGGNYYSAGSHNPANTLTQVSTEFANNPKTGAAWTVAQVNGTDGTNALQAFGWISTDANPQIDFSSIRLRVVYTPLAERTGSGATTAPAQDTAAAGEPVASGSGATASAAQDTAAAGEPVVSGSGATTSPAQATSGAGTVADSGRTGSGATAAAAQDTAATGTVQVSGTAAASSPAQDASAAGTVLVVGSGAMSAPAGDTAGAGGVSVDGSAVTAAAVQDTTAIGSVTVAGSGATESPAQQTAGTSEQEERTGSGATTAPAQDASGAASVTVSGSAATTSPGQRTVATGTAPSVAVAPVRCHPPDKISRKLSVSVRYN